MTPTSDALHKPSSPMKSIWTLPAFALLLVAGCVLGNGDAFIRRHAAGVWESDADPGKVIENKADGTYVIRVNGIEKVRGNWWVSNGYLVGKPENDGFRMESNKVVSLTQDKITIISIDRQAELTFHRH